MVLFYSHLELRRQVDSFVIASGFAYWCL
ncbi:hypothetical protein LINPERPRIM_LOCUS37257 [Linum perenne]